MTGNHRNSSITRRRALAVTGGTVAAGGFAVTLDTDLHARAWSPRGSAGLLAGALFVDTLPVTTDPCPI